MKKKLIRAAVATVSLLTLAAIALSAWLLQLYSEVSERLSQGWFKAPIEFYTEQEVLAVGQNWPQPVLESLLLERGFTARTQAGDISLRQLRPNQYVFLSPSECQTELGMNDDPPPSMCLGLHQNPSENNNERTYILSLDEHNTIQNIHLAESKAKVDEMPLDSYLFAQFYGDKPILRQVLKVADIPLYCLQAVTAIEDKDFLEHKGFSPLGFARAAVKNLISGYYAQGGSTITQQLVKNYFLSPEKTLRRKLREIFMALILELQVDKDAILENYLNVIYMGQNGPFEVRGFGAAAHHYLRKDVTELSLGECAMLAALLNNPGRYNPFKNPDLTRTRRDLVLSKMAEFKMIGEADQASASATELVNSKEPVHVEPAPYYVNAIFKELKTLDIIPRFAEDGLKIYTRLRMTPQKIAQAVVRGQLTRLEEQRPVIKKWLQAGKRLQSFLIFVDLKTNGIVALVGGRDFKDSQFNRAVDSRRQVGSIMKPLVYLAALETTDSEGKPYGPLTMISDVPFTHTYENQRWAPENYDKKSYGEVPMFFALKNSLNIATAKLGLDVGLSSIIEVARRLGIQSTLQPVPSLTLGAFELSPIEVATAYSGIAKMGSVPKLQLFSRVESLNGQSILENEYYSEQSFAPEVMAQLVSMLKATFTSGTARSARQYGFERHAAGKTGTTSDTKDSWFAGFTPEFLALVWVGYDDNTPTELTGASGALPIWSQFMNEVLFRNNDPDFTWPEGTEVKSIDANEIKTLTHGLDDADEVDLELVVPSNSQ